jgi:hypothetical protein
MTLRPFHMPGSLLLVALFLGCDRPVPVGPRIEAAAGSQSGPTVQAPSNTNATPASQSRIDVSWQDNSTNETGFEVHRSTSGLGGTYTLLASMGAGFISYSDVGLASATPYCYKVRAFRTTGSKTTYSQFSTTACATTPAPPPPPPAPAAPSGVAAVPQTSAMVWVGWSDNSINEAGLRVERSLDAGASWTIAGTLGPDIIAFVDGGRASEQSVCYRVIAFNAGGDSPASNVDCTTPPAGPTDLRITGFDSVALAFEITWTDNSAVEDGYEVVSCFEDCTTVDRLPANSTSYFISCTDHNFFVVAMKDGGYSDGSNTVHPGLRPECAGTL